MLARSVRLADLLLALENAQRLSALGRATVGSQQQPVRAGGLWTLGDLDVMAGSVVTTQEESAVRIASGTTHGANPPRPALAVIHDASLNLLAVPSFFVWRLRRRRRRESLELS